ncbi:glycosyltransferase [Actinocrispum wychmicini]|uniref:glycosyltransferase n=1 Tax=Actinocrispum wychmicini TaxID=1213861 RepID=UPI00104E5E13|nr:glycosyltransferase [Actinocrispum wychmicini]
MRILFSFVGGRGHFEPLVPLAGAAAAAGHTIHVTCQRSMVPSVQRAGFAATESGPDYSGDGKRLPLIVPDRQKEDDDLRNGFARRAARLRAKDVLKLSARWRPDVIVCDEFDFGAMIAASVLGLPHVTVEVSAAGSFIRPSVVASALDEVRAEHGLPSDPELAMLSEHLWLSPFPPGFRDPAFGMPANGHRYRTRDTVQAKPEQPTIYFTLGTIFNTESGDLFARGLAGLRELPVDLVVTVGDMIDPAEFGPQPAHVRVERFIPQDEVLPTCSMVVSHGGSGSLYGALLHGLPSVLVPMGADQLLNGPRAEAVGIARVLHAVTATAEDFREAAADVLETPSYRRAAEGLRDEIAELPPAPYAMSLIERLG